MRSLLDNIREQEDFATCGNLAKDHFTQFFCAESVLLAVATATGETGNTGKTGESNDVLPRIATGFCSGTGRTGSMCGAVAGAVMGISLVHGRDSAHEDVAPAYSRVQILINEITTKYKSCNCSELTSCNLGTEEGRAEFKERNLKQLLCDELAYDCAALALWLCRAPHQTIQNMLK